MMSWSARLLSAYRQNMYVAAVVFTITSWWIEDSARTCKKVHLTSETLLLKYAQNKRFLWTFKT